MYKEDIMLTIKSLAGIALLLNTTALAVADETPKLWKGNAEIGIVKTAGNSTTQSITAGGGITYERDRWRHVGTIDILNTSSDNVTSAERYAATGQSNYKLDALSYVFGRLGYENDRFAGFDYRTTEVIGYGRRVINSDAITLDLEAGPGARQTRFTNDGSTSEAMGRVAGLFAWKVSATATFTEDLSSDIGQDATITKSITALKAQVAGNLAMKASLTLRNISTVPADKKNTDTETALTLVYGF
jgi:putative salt-induced outer membrane protein